MKNLKIYLSVFFAVTYGAFICSANAQMMATISENVSTDFAIYHPYAANFTPIVPTFTVASDFSNVSNYQEMSYLFNSKEEDLLQQNHFTVKKSRYQQLFDIYNLGTWDGIPIFVTTDAVLHTYHTLFDRLLAEIEMHHFVNALDQLTETLINETKSQLTQTEKVLASDAVYHNLAFLCVAAELLNGPDTSIPDTVSALVNSEISYITDHNGFHYSPVLGNFSQLDYSQFKPRGHYTKNDTLKAYFKTMIWYGWTILTMETNLFGDLSSSHTLQSLMLVQMLYSLHADGQSLLDLWKQIYEPTIFYVGKTDDPNVCDYKSIADQIYGADFLTLSPDSLANQSLLDAFMAEAQKLPEPKIPNWIYGTYIQYKGFRLMGQRFIPDSYMFAHLIYPYVGTASNQRWMPKGLDIMAILGSDRAFRLLDSVYHETAHYNYAEQIDQFNTEYKNKPAADWAQNLYWNWLYCLMPLLYEKGSGYPYFMQTEAWANKDLLTALASWTELRHDAILYAKQSMTPCGIAPGAPRSYVEPNPHLYARLASLVTYTRYGLENFDLLIEDFRDKLDLFEVLLLFLRDISIKELENKALTEAEYENIFCFGKAMQDLVSEYADPQNPWHSNTDNMAVVADVHTDSNTDNCLEEGVGYPLEIFVIVNEGGISRITRGAVFSYYEFTRSIANRLTDEEWRGMLNEFEAPAMPEWFAGFMDVGVPQPQFITDSPDNLYEKTFTNIEMEEHNPLPITNALFQNYPNPFNPSTKISWQSPVGSWQTLKLYDILGNEVATLVDEYRQAGKYEIKFNAKSLASGVYFYQLRVGDFIETRKMVILR